MPKLTSVWKTILANRTKPSTEKLVSFTEHCPTLQRIGSTPQTTNAMLSPPSDKISWASCVYAKLAKKRLMSGKRKLAMISIIGMIGWSRRKLRKKTMQKRKELERRKRRKLKTELGTWLYTVERALFQSSLIPKMFHEHALILNIVSLRFLKFWLALFVGTTCLLDHVPYILISDVTSLKTKILLLSMTKMTSWTRFSTVCRRSKTVASPMKTLELHFKLTVPVTRS